MAFWQKHSGSAEYLSGLSFFEGFAPEELARISELGREVELASGAELMDQGEIGLTCYVLVEGTASVYIGGEHVASLPAGSMVGEMALIDHRPRRAAVIAVGDVKAIEFDTRAFATLLDEMPRARDRVMALLHTRLQANQANRA